MRDDPPRPGFDESHRDDSPEFVECKVCGRSLSTCNFIGLCEMCEREADETNQPTKASKTMIERATMTRYVVGGKEFRSLRDAQFAELEALCPSFNREGSVSDNAVEFAAAILNNKDKVLDVLTTTETSLAKARKVNGGRKVRKARSTAPATTASGATAEQAV